MDDKLELILALVRELQSDTKANGERLARLETTMKSVVGNGSPGRLDKMDEAIAKLQEWRWWMVGAAAGSGVVLGGLGWVIEIATKR